MKNNKTPEMLLTQVLCSPTIKKLALVIVLAGIVICLVPLLPPVQNILFSFVDERISRKGSGGDFESRLLSLLTLPLFGLLVFIFSLCCLFSKKIAAFLENENNDTLVTSIAFGLNILLVGFVSFFSYRYGWQLLNSDASSEMVLGKLLAQENVFVSPNWHYSTEIRLIYQTIFSMPLFKMLGNTDNWALIRALVILCNSIVIILSYFFLMKQIKVQTKWIVITSLFLLMPISTGYWGIVIFGGYYAFFVAQLFCTIGLFIRIAGRADTEKAPIVEFILFTLLSFLLGMQGIRSLLSIYMPLLIMCVYLWSKILQKKNFPLFLGCYGFLMCGIGFVANYALLFKYKFHSFDKIRLADLWLEFFPKLGQSMVGLVGFFGLAAGKSLLSASGILSLLAIIGTVILFWYVFRSCIWVKATEHRYMTVFFAIAVLSNIFVFIIAEESVTARYFIPFMVLYIPLLAILFNNTKMYNYLKRTAIICGIMLFILGQSYIHFQSMAEQNSNTTRKGYIQYLLDNQLEYGFATFWNANVTTELSNGKIEMVGLNSNGLNPDNPQFRIHHWLIPVQFSDPLYHSGESFLLVSRSEWEQAQTAGRQFAQIQPDYQDDNFIVIRYPSAQIVHQEVLDN